MVCEKWRWAEIPGSCCWNRACCFTVEIRVCEGARRRHGRTIVDRDALEVEEIMTANASL